jgi:hypothetical protein
VNILQKTVGCSGQGKNKNDGLGSARLFWALFGSLGFFWLFLLIFA